mgnify:FL=1
MNLAEAIRLVNAKVPFGQQTLVASKRQASKWRNGYGAAWSEAHGLPYRLHIPGVG